MIYLFVIFGIASLLSFIGWAYFIITEFKKNKKKSRYNDPHDVFYH